MSPSSKSPVVVGARADARTSGGDVRGDRQVGVRKCASVSNGSHMAIERKIDRKIFIVF